MTPPGIPCRRGTWIGVPAEVDVFVRISGLNPRPAGRVEDTLIAEAERVPGVPGCRDPVCPYLGKPGTDDPDVCRRLGVACRSPVDVCVHADNPAVLCPIRDACEAMHCVMRGRART